MLANMRPCRHDHLGVGSFWSRFEVNCKSHSVGRFAAQGSALPDFHEVSNERCEKILHKSIVSSSQIRLVCNVDGAHKVYKKLPLK